jgi:hypothetical protein
MHMNTIPANYDTLVRQNLELRRELDDLKTRRRETWSLLVEASRKLQLSSTSVKVAVSSLLDHDIFWDGANQYEFLSTIDASIDQVSRLALLLALAFRSEADRLELRREPHSLQEIMAAVKKRTPLYFPRLKLEILLPEEGKPILADFEYLTLAFSLLGEVIEVKADNTPVLAEVIEEAEYLYLDFSGLDRPLIELIENMPCSSLNKLAATDYLPPEFVLRVYLICHILHLHEIDVAGIFIDDHAPKLRLRIPAIAKA